MSIRLQLNLLISAILFSFIIAIGVYIGNRLPLERLLDEQERLESVSESIVNLRLDISLSASLPLGARLEAVKSSRATMEESFGTIQKLVYLKRANKAIQISLVSIQSQQMLLSFSLDEFETKVGALLDTVFSFSENPASLRTRDMYDLLLSGTVGKSRSESIAYDIGIFLDEIANLDQSMAGILSAISQQFAAIQKEVGKIEAKAMLSSMAVMGLIIIVGLALGLVISSRIHTSFRDIEAHIKVLETGDLTFDFSSSGKGEIGHLSARLNSFLSNLRAVIVQIKGVLSRNDEIRGSLIDAAGQSSSSLEEMRASIAAVESKITTLDEKISESTSSSGRIASSVGELDSLLSDLSSMVEETSASIVQMIASIANVAKIAVERRKSAGELVKIAVAGGDQLSIMADTINEVDANLDDVNEIVQVIMNISTQTDLLAMNAAIEAAHAGDAGKGFSVVAEEIRSLAEAVNEQSKNIKDNIQKIVEMIKAAAGESGATLEAFKSINDGVAKLDSSLAEISDTMTEINSGGMQINEAVTHLRDISVRAKEASREIAESSRKSSEASKAEIEISAFVRSSMADISLSSQEIAKVAEKTVEHSKEMSRTADEVNERIRFFKTGEPSI